MVEREPGLEVVIAKAGSINKLARALGLAQPSVTAWKKVPKRHVLKIEDIYRIPRHELRPDLYDPPPRWGRGRPRNPS